MARRSSRTAASSSGGGGESSTVLVIFLVFFVLISLTLGVFLYLAQDKIATAEANEKKAKDSQKTADLEAKRERDYWRVKLMSWIDPTSVTEDEMAAMQTVEREPNFAQSRPEKFAGLQKIMEGDPAGATPEAKDGVVGPVDGATGKPKNPLLAKIKSREQELATALKNFATKQKDFDTQKLEFSQYQKDYNAEVVSKQVKAAQDAAEAQKKQALDQKEQELADARKKITDTTQNLAKELADMKKEFEEREKKIRGEVDSEKDKLIALQQELRIKYGGRTLVNLDKPRGRIVSVDRYGELVHINLGSDAHLPPQVSFSVYGRGPGGKVLPEPKAKIELVRILDKTLALCRVTAVAKPAAIRAEADPDREAFWITDPKNYFKATEPILPDDLLFNPIWDPERPIHVALVGFFDIDGDGQDDLDTLLRMLRDMGAVIDAYPDLKEGYKMIGKLDYFTDYLIIGGQPPSISGAGKKTVDERSRFEEDAQRRGIEILRLQKFLDRIGYSSIRVPTSKGGAGLPKAAPPKEEGK